MSIIHIPKSAQPRSDREAILLAELQAATAVTKERRSGHFISIDSRDLRELIGCRYIEVLRPAQEAGFIEINPRYSVGRFPKSYRLVARLRTPATQPYFIERDSTATRTGIRIADDDEIGQALVDCFQRVRLPETLPRRGWSAYIVQRMQLVGCYAVRCAYNRFHTSFTALPKWLRRSLRFDDGDQLVELDVANAQPLLVGLLATRFLEAAPAAAFQHPNKPRRHIQNTPTHDTTTPPIPYVAHSSDLQDYLDLCAQGRLYEHLLDRCRERRLTLHQTIPPERLHKYGQDRPLARQDVKRQFIVAMFAENTTAERMPLFQIVAGAFPTVAQYMTTAKAGEYQALARDAQRLESSLVIDGAAAEIVTAGLPIITIHDSLIVRRRDEQLARDAIVRQFASFGVVPTIGAA